MERDYLLFLTDFPLADDEGETKHLLALDGADTRLRLFQMDLLDPASVRPAIDGARGVFHWRPRLYCRQKTQRQILFRVNNPLIDAYHSFRIPSLE